MCCLLQDTLYGNTIKKPAIKEKTNHQRKNRTSCQSLSVTSADTVLTQCYVKILILSSRKKLESTIVYINIVSTVRKVHADYEKDDFSSLRLFCTTAITHLLCLKNFVCLLGLKFHDLCRQTQRKPEHTVYLSTSTKFFVVSYSHADSAAVHSNYLFVILVTLRPKTTDYWSCCNSNLCFL